MPSSTAGFGLPSRTPESKYAVPFHLSARTLISVAFHSQPEIKSSFQQFKAEEARYDFFYVSHDVLTPRFRATNQVVEGRFVEASGNPPKDTRIVTRNRDHAVEVGVEKQFFDTTRLNFATGYDTATEGFDSGVDAGNIGNHPFVSANLRYPLGQSRERLERTSEDIFRRNELNDAQLAYIKDVRKRLQNALEQFNEAVEIRTRAASAEHWLSDLQSLDQAMNSLKGRDLTTDHRRLQAELIRVASEARNLTGKFKVEFARLQYKAGLPYELPVDLDEEPFNPFAGSTHDVLIRATIETDPEILTLTNAMHNAQVQLDLARRGKWDVALLLEGRSNLEGRGADDRASDWSVAVGVDVSAIDPRVTSSLARQAEASIERFKQAIADREQLIFVDTLEPLIRIETLSASRDDLRDNLPRYHDDYETGVKEYLAGTLNIDDLLKRRENLFEQEKNVAELTNVVGINVAELCSATGKFFELLDGPQP